MSTQQTALENLRVIRSLMEKAHIYRAISAPAALVGGGLAIVVSVLQFFVCGGVDVSRTEFLVSWIAVLTVATVVNLTLLYREARKRSQAFVSPGMAMAVRAILPAMGVGGVIGTGIIVFDHKLALGSTIWIVCYGLALLATSGFSPRSLTRLGWAFVVSGLGIYIALNTNELFVFLGSDERPASFAMGLTFGLLHIGYGIAVLVSKKPEPLPAE